METGSSSGSRGRPRGIRFALREEDLKDGIMGLVLPREQCEAHIISQLQEAQRKSLAADHWIKVKVHDLNDGVLYEMYLEKHGRKYMLDDWSEVVQGRKRIGKSVLRSGSIVDFVWADDGILYFSAA